MNKELFFTRVLVIPALVALCGDRIIDVNSVFFFEDSCRIFVEMKASSYVSEFQFCSHCEVYPIFR
jgi:hypothetical protein